MKKYYIFLISILALLLYESCAKDEEVMTGTINGFVSDYTNANSPIAGATVTLNPKGLTKTTGSDGRFEFTGLEPNTYSLSVSANDYQPTSKQITVYAGQTANCDFQLSIGSVVVDINPTMLSFGKDTEQLSFSISNKSTRTLTYTISNIPDFVKISPTTGNVVASGNQTITVSVLNRTSITASRNGQFTVNIGNDSYNISVNVEPYQEETVSIDIHPTTLNFDKDTEQLSFTMTSNYSKDLQYTISSNLDILTVSPYEGTLKGKGQTNITVTIKDRQNIDALRRGQLTISIGGNTYVVDVSVAKAEDKTESGDISQTVRNGLYALFTFEDDFKDLSDTELTAVGVGTSFVESFNESKALKIPAKDDVMLSIPEGLVDQPKMSISFWAKDLTDGHIFHAINDDGNRTSFLLSVDNGKLKFVCTQYNIGYQYANINAFAHNSLSGWHMITLVSDFNNGNIITKLYIDGNYTDLITEGDNPFGESEGGSGQKNYRNCHKFIMGGNLNSSNIKLNASTLFIDNLRIYKYRLLSEDEVKTIYNKEKK